MSDPTNALPMPYQSGNVKPSGACPVCGGCDVRVIRVYRQVQVACWNSECTFSIVMEGCSTFDAVEIWDRLRVVE